MHIMTFSSQDFKKIQWAVLLLMLSLLIASAAVWMALAQQKVILRAHHSLITAEKDMAANLMRARNEEQELRDKITRYEVLRQRGIVGVEHRLDWIELIDQIKTARRIQKLTYDYSPQQKLDAALLPEGTEAGGVNFMSSQMHLQLALLHEGELLGFLNDLRAKASALIQIRSCTLTRNPMGPVDATQQGIRPQLKADCILEWITLKPSISS